MKMIKDFCTAARQRPPATFGGATLLTLVMAGYVGYVGATGGIVNPNQPQSQQDVYGAVSHHLAGKQDADELIRDSRRPPRVIRTMFGNYNPDDEYRDRVAESFARHREYLSGQMMVSQGMSTDMALFRQEHLANLPGNTRVGVSGVQPRTVLFRKGQYCELLCTSSMSASRVYDEYIRSLVTHRWLLDEFRFDDGGKWGYITAISGSMILEICVLERELFPESRTTVLWALTSPDGAMGSWNDSGARHTGEDPVSAGDGGSPSAPTPARPTGNKRGPQ